MLYDFSEMFKFVVRKLCIIEGKRVSYEYEFDVFVFIIFVNLLKFVISV